MAIEDFYKQTRAGKWLAPKDSGMLMNLKVLYEFRRLEDYPHRALIGA